MTPAANRSLRAKALQTMEQFEGLPSMPQIIQRVREISENPQSSAADLANIILSDHSLTTRLLRIGNSAFYGQYSGKVSTITQAIILMGFNAVRNTVMGIAVYDSLAQLDESAEFDLPLFWAKSLGCGVIAKCLATRLRFKSSEEAFIAGFMHDIGQPVICIIYHQDIAKIGQLVSRTDDPVRHEREKLGIDHQEVGEWLGKKWNLPPVLLKAMRNHHRLNLGPREKSPSPFVDLVYAADMIVNKLTDTAVKKEAIADLVADDLQQLLGIKHEDLREIVRTAVEQIEEIAVELNIPITGFATHTGESPPAKTVAPAPPPEYLETLQKLSEVERELTFFREVSLAFKSGASEAEILQTLLEGVYRGLEFGRALLLRIDRTKHLARGVLGFGVSSQQQVHDLKIPLKEGVGAVVNCVVEDKTINILDTSAEIYKSILDPDEQQILQSQAFCLFPISIIDTVEYVVFVENPEGQPVQDDKVRSADSFASQAGMALERFRLRQLMAGKKNEEDVDSLITLALKN